MHCMRAEPSLSPSSQLSFRRASGETGEILVLVLSGDWHLKRGFASGSAVGRELAQSPAPRRVAFEAAGLGEWDSSLVAVVTEVMELCLARDVAVDPSGLPSGLKRLVELAEAVPEKKEAHSASAGTPLAERVGVATIAYVESIGGFLAFLGAVTIALGRFFARRARYRRVELLRAPQGLWPTRFGA